MTIEVPTAAESADGTGNAAGNASLRTAPVATAATVTTVPTSAASMATTSMQTESGGGGEGSESAEDYRGRARRGLAALGAQSALKQLLVFGSNIYLARELTPSDYGIFGLLNFAMSFFMMVGDAGLAASLVQRKEQPDHAELSSLWWLQLGLALGLVGLAFAIAPVLPLFIDGFPPTAVWLMRGLSLGLVFTMLRTTPFLLLERQLHFGKISGLEFLGSLGFYGVAIVLVAYGAGASALVTAAVVQLAIIALAANVLQPFRPAFVFHWARIKSYVRFGVSFQAIHVAGFANSAVTPLLVSARLGTDGLGIVQFAQQTAWIPTVLISIVRRVSFPYFSRLQGDRAAFAREFDNAIALSAVPVFFMTGLFLGNGEAIVLGIYSDKWAAAVPAIIVFSMILSVNFFGWIAGAALEALGQPGTFLRLTILAAVINWAATTTAVMFWPTPLAFAVGFSAHVVVNNFGLFFALRRLAPAIRPLRRVLPMALAGAVVSGLGRITSQWTTGIFPLVLWVLASIGVFAGIVLVADGDLRRKLRARVERFAERRPTTLSDE
ncbi:MAG: oligosaccharide flippase family protein [Deltaproteobacteria bacterium]|nr:oligosaccharide flippase family protein [Deltaproteobacteria bacterium]